MLQNELRASALSKTAGQGSPDEFVEQECVRPTQVPRVQRVLTPRSPAVSCLLPHRFLVHMPRESNELQHLLECLSRVDLLQACGRARIAGYTMYSRGHSPPLQSANSALRVFLDRKLAIPLVVLGGPTPCYRWPSSSK